MNIRRKILLCGFALLVTLMLLFPPRFWKIDDGVAWDITYNWVFAPVRYAGRHPYEGHSATNFGGIEWNLVVYQALAALFVSVVLWTLAGDQKAKAPSR